LAVALSDAPATVGYWLLAAAVLSGVMATVLLTTKVARVTATDTETSNISPLRREVG